MAARFQAGPLLHQHSDLPTPKAESQLRTATRYSNPCALRLSWAGAGTRPRLHRLAASRTAPLVCNQTSVVCIGTTKRSNRPDAHVAIPSAVWYWPATGGGKDPLAEISPLAGSVFASAGPWRGGGGLVEERPQTFQPSGDRLG